MFLQQKNIDCCYLTGSPLIIVLLRWPLMLNEHQPCTVQLITTIICLTLLSLGLRADLSKRIALQTCLLSSATVMYVMISFKPFLFIQQTGCILTQACCLSLCSFPVWICRAIISEHGMLFLCRSPNVAFRPISRMLLHVKTLPGAAIMNYPPTSVFHCTCSHMGIMKCTEITGALDTAQFCEVIVFDQVVLMCGRKVLWLITQQFKHIMCWEFCRTL